MDENLIGTLINERYRLEAEIGRGGMGAVYRARDTILKRDVAVKVMSPGRMGTSGRVQLLREARAAARLNHPNIVAIHDVGETELPGQDEKTSFIIMEFVEGKSLRAFQPQSLDEAVDIVMQICAALEQAHHEDIVHGDLKPGNIVITPSRSVKLMDFGLAHVAGQSDVGAEGTITGTLTYLSPEAILGHATSRRSDFYALGALTYELVAGRSPFEGEDLTALLSQQLHAEVVPPSTYNDQIPPALDALILQLLSKRPEERPVSAADIRQSLIDWKRPAQALAIEAGGEYGILDRMVSGRLVGRRQELARAVDLWNKAAAGEGQVLFVSGEPGVGKTRLVRELTTFAQLAGGTVLTSGCYGPGTAPYAPFAKIIRLLLQDGSEIRLSEPVMADLLALAPDLQATFPNIPANEPLDPEAQQLRMFDSVLSLWRDLTEKAPVMTFIDDVHWADSGTISLLRQLAHHAHHQRLMIVATYREIELHQSRAFQELLHNLYRERLVTRIKLARLSKEQTGKMLDTLFSTSTAPDFLERIYQETEGNPFFVEEVCRALIERGQIHFSGGQWRRESGGELEVPQGIQVAIQSRLDGLSPPELEVLHLAALLGRQFNYKMLRTICEAVAGLDEEKLINALDNAERAKIVREVEPANITFPTRRAPGPEQLSFAFTHGLIHTALLADLSTLRRQRLQLNVALALEKAVPNRLDELGPLLGRYFAEAGEADKAVKYLLKAGDGARKIYAYDEAIKAYEQALLFLDEGEQRDEVVHTLMNLGLLYHNTFRFERSRQSYDRGFALWQQAAKAATAADDLPGSTGEHLALHIHDPRTLDPARCSDGVSEFYIRQFFSGLIELGPDGEVLPDTAESWEVLDAGRRYIFYLRQGACWSDGRVVTAGDFEFAWKRALDPENGTSPAGFLHDVKGARAYNLGQTDDPEKVGVHAPNDHTLVVELEGPTGYFLQVLTRGVTMPVPRHALHAHGRGWIEPSKFVSNGPFRPTLWQPGERMDFVRNEHFCGRIGGNLDRITVITSVEAPLLEMYETGDLDVLRLNDLPLLEADRARYQHVNEYMSLPLSVTTYLSFDTTRSPFDDPRVRRAFALALDKPHLANITLRGQSFAATGGFVPPGIPGHVPSTTFSYDPESARRLLEEVGHPDGRGLPSLELRVIRQPGMEAFNAELRSSWQRVLGVTVDLRELWFADFLESLEEQRPLMWKSGWSADYPDPDNFLRACPFRQVSGWTDRRYEQLVEQARRIPDAGERHNMYLEAEKILTEEAVLVPLLYSRDHLLLKPWVKRYPAEPVGGLALKDVVVSHAD